MKLVNFKLIFLLCVLLPQKENMISNNRLTITILVVEMTSLISEIAAIPTISSGTLLDNSGENFELTLSIRKYCGSIAKKSNYLWKSNGSLAESNSEIKFRSLSPNAEILLIGKSSGEKERFIEVWNENGNQFVTSINVSSIHDDFCTDGTREDTIYEMLTFF